MELYHEMEQVAGYAKQTRLIMNLGVDIERGDGNLCDWASREIHRVLVVSVDMSHWSAWSSQE